MSYARIRNFGNIGFEEEVQVVKEDFDEEIQNEWLPKITMKSYSDMPIHINVIAEGLHGIKELGAWVKVGEIRIEIIRPKLGWRDRLRILLKG